MKYLKESCWLCSDIHFSIKCFPSYVLPYETSLKGVAAVWSLYALMGKATPIYLLVLRAQEVGNEPFWNKKKS